MGTDNVTDQDLASATRITDLVVEFISIVDQPATGRTFTLKSQDGRPLSMRPFALVKADDDLQIAYGIVYPANTVDAHGEWADAATIRKAMERFMRDALTGNIDKQHNFAKADAYAVECWIVRKGDPMFPDEPEGSWAAGVKVLDPDLWRALKAGNYTGFSLAGFGVRHPPPSQGQDSFLAKLKEVFAPFIKQEPTEVPITPEEKADIAKSVIDLLKAEGVIKAAPPVNTPPPNTTADQGADVAALAKSVADIVKSLEKLPDTISDTVMKAVAKGASESGLGGGASPVSSFL